MTKKRKIYEYNVYYNYDYSVPLSFDVQDGAVVDTEAMLGKHHDYYWNEDFEAAEETAYSSEMESVCVPYVKSVLGNDIVTQFGYDCE